MKKDYLIEFFLKFDLFGKKPMFRVDKNDSFRSLFGSILTVSAILLMFCTLIYFSLGLWDRLRPNIILSIINTFNPPEIKLSNDTFGFAFGIQDPLTYNNFIDESIYRVEVYQKIARRQQDSGFQWEVIKLETEPCNKYKFPDSYKNLVTDLPLNNMYCLKDSNFTVFGTFLNPTYAFLYIAIYECKNTTTQQNCKPKIDIDKILAGTFFLFSHTDITIDPTNYTDPNQKFLGDSYTTISNRYFKELHHYEKQIIIRTNKGWLIDDFEENSYLKLDYVKEMIDFRNAENFLSYTFKLSTSVETYTRSYKKVQSVFAEVGGIFKVITMTCAILTYFWNRAKINESLANELFIIHEKEDEVYFDFSKIDRSSLHGIDNIESNNSSPIGKKTMNAHALSNVRKNNFFRELETNHQKQKIKKIDFKLSFCEGFFIYIFPCCFKKNKNYLILKKIEPNIDHQFEIMNIFKHLNEMNRLKFILFDEDQRKLLSIPHKTLINLAETSTKHSIYDLKDKEFSLDEYKKSYLNLKSRENDPISEKLLKIIEFDMRQLLI